MARSCTSRSTASSAAPLAFCNNVALHQGVVVGVDFAGQRTIRQGLCPASTAVGVGDRCRGRTNNSGVQHVWGSVGPAMVKNTEHHMCCCSELHSFRAQKNNFCQLVNGHTCRRHFAASRQSLFVKPLFDASKQAPVPVPLKQQAAMEFLSSFSCIYRHQEVVIVDNMTTWKLTDRIALPGGDLPQAWLSLFVVQPLALPFQQCPCQTLQVLAPDLPVFPEILESGASMAMCSNV